MLILKAGKQTFLFPLKDSLNPIFLSDIVIY